jgi:hypothetical protein
MHLFIVLCVQSAESCESQNEQSSLPRPTAHCEVRKFVYYGYQQHVTVVTYLLHIGSTELHSLQTIDIEFE